MKLLSGWTIILSGWAVQALRQPEAQMLRKVSDAVESLQKYLPAAMLPALATPLLKKMAMQFEAFSRVEGCSLHSLQGAR